MKSLLFFDDWVLRVREGFDRKQGKPVCLKEIVLKSHPELYRIRGADKDDRNNRAPPGLQL